MLGSEIKVMVGRRSAMTVDLSGDTPSTVLAAELVAEVQGKMTP